ncbi:hypothetical protein [Microbacterium sp.]|uniref:hypothetical protein n=1 Tax=Microbacterium sp. TaxID=51671 RepID=UPI003A8D519E
MTDQTAPGYTPTTTHAEWGAGAPRLLVSREDDRFVHHITIDAVRIGSADGNELQLADTDPVHASIAHDDRDEYVLTLHGAGEMNASPLAAETDGGDRSEILRTGARFTAGPWTLVFSRDEFADHGRPYGGREGGELDDQPAQPARPDYTDRGDEEPDPADLEVKDG